MSVAATFKHQDGYSFHQIYRTRKGFLQALIKSKDSVLDNAVDTDVFTVIRMHNLEEYKKKKLK